MSRGGTATTRAGARATGRRTSTAALTVVVVVAGGAFAAPAGADSVHGMSATGRAVYHDVDGGVHPIRDARVQMCDDDFPLGECELMGEGRTGDDGTFEIFGAGGDLEGLPDVYVRVLAETPAGAVQLETGVGLFSYCMATAKVDDYDPLVRGFDIEVGEISPADTVACFGFEPFGDVPTEEAAWELLDHLTTAHEFTIGDPFSTPIGDSGPVAVLWPSDLNGVPWYNPVPPTIRFNRAYERGLWRFTMFHEYGHHVLYSHAESPLPDYNNDTCDETNPLAHLPLFGGHCIWQEEKGSIHWTEGVPQFFAMAVAEWDEPGSMPAFGYETPCPTTGSERCPVDGADPAQIEGWTTAVLWDLLDDADDNHDGDTDPHKSQDQLTFDFEAIWDVVQTDPDPTDDGHDHPTTIREFRRLLVAQYPQLTNQINGLYTENRIPYRGADLFVDDVYLVGSSREVVRGSTYSFTATTHNRAGSATDTGQDSATRISLVDVGTGEVHDLASITVPVLPADGSDTGLVPVRVPSHVLPGTYQLRACADAEHRVYETAPPGQPIADMLPNCADGPEVTVANRIPVADAGGPYTADEGQVVVVDGSGSHDPDGDDLTHAWTPPDGAVVDGPLDQPLLALQGLDDGDHEVTLQVHDGFDPSEVDTATITITNTAPEVLVGPELSGDEGAPVTQSATATDRGPDEMTATVDWGDGSPTTDLGPVDGSVEFTHTYDDDGTYTARLCVTDDDDATTCEDFGVVVANVAPVVTGVDQESPVLALVATTVEVTFTDAGVRDGHTATIDWGDGAPPEPATVTSPTADMPGSAQGVHAYGHDGVHTATACVSDELDTTCHSWAVEVLTPAAALTHTIDALQTHADDPAVAAALTELDGTATQQPGARQKLADGDVVAAITKVSKAIADLDTATVDHTAQIRSLTLLVESIAREVLATVEALGLTSRGDLRQLQRVRDDVAAGRAAYDEGRCHDAVDAYLAAVRRAVSYV